MKLLVVNESDSVIGVKDRNELLPEDIYRVSRLVISNAKGQLLLAQRAFVKENDPGVWGMAVEGRVEENEDYESNIRKEAEEEIGIALGSIELGPKLRMTGKYNHWCQFFLYHTELDTSQLHLQEDELAAVKWYDPKTLKQEVNNNPGRFGYNFSLILETIWPTLVQPK